MPKRNALLIITLTLLAFTGLAWLQYFWSRESVASRPELFQPITVAITVADGSHKGRVATQSESGKTISCVYGFDAIDAGEKNYMYRIELERIAGSEKFKITQVTGFTGLNEDDVISLNNVGQWRHEEMGVTVEIDAVKSDSSN